MRKVLFDGTSMQVDSRVLCHGGSVYAETIFIEAIKRGYKFDVVFQQDLKIPNNIKVALDREHKDITDLYIHGKSELYALIAGNDYDVFYSVLPYEYFDYKGDTPIIGVLHGARNIELPWDNYYYRFQPSVFKRITGWLISRLPFMWNLRRKKYLLRMNRLIRCPNFQFITVSEHSKHAFLNFFPTLRPEEISVYYSPIKLNTPIEQPDKSKSNFYLLVSGNRAEKNVYRAIKAFDKLMNDGRLANKYIVITGVPNPKVFTGIHNREHFQFLPYVSKDELGKLFQEAYCFVYPSLNEGFGYPPLQAMLSGTPVIASSATSIPEVCGNAALYFSPTNIDDLCSRILQIEYNPKVYDRLVVAGQKRVEELRRRQELDLDAQLNMIFEKTLDSSTI